MIEKNLTYKCKCSKCSHGWNTRKDKLPERCAACNVTGWNSDYLEPETKPQLTLTDQVRELSVADRLELFAEFELCCGMNRGACICPAEEIEIAPIASPPTGKLNLDQLKALIAPIENGEVMPTISAPVEDVWIEDPVTYENGEKLFWHHRPKCKPVIYKREIDYDSAT